MNDTVNRNRLIDLAAWLTAEEHRRRLGKPSHWNQDVWVDTDQDSTPLLAVEAEDRLVIQGWSCGTAACAAGHIALEDGGLPAFYYRMEMHPEPPSAGDAQADLYGLLGAAFATLSSTFMYFPDREGPLEVEYYARDALGLDNDQATRLFAGGNKWGDMIDVIADITGMSEYELTSAVGGDQLPPDLDYDEDDDEDEDDNSECDCGCNDL